METTGYNNEQFNKPNTLTGKFAAFRDKYRVQLSVTLAVVASVTFIVAEIIPPIQKFIFDSGLLQYLIFLFLLDLTVSIYLQQKSPTTSLVKNQDESMPRLIEAVKLCRSDGADLIEYAGATTLPLIRAIQREGVKMRLLVKHPETILGIQRERMITTLDTLYNSIFEDSVGKFEIRCYKLPYTLRGRRLGKEILEIGWLTPDKKRQMAFGHSNPSVLVDLSVKHNDYLLKFFDKTFDDLWNDDETEDGKLVLDKYQIKT
jgi:hypothetical protein